MSLQVNDLRLTVDGLEKERDFYFGKLRDIEVLCQENDAMELPLVKQIMEILYATEVMLCPIYVGIYTPVFILMGNLTG